MNFEDYHAIVNLIGRYGMILDQGSQGRCTWDRLAEIFAEDAVFDLSAIDAGVLDGLEEISRAMELGTHPWGHHVTNPVVVASGPDSATCDTKLMAVLADGRVSTGTYHDEIVRRTDGEWRIVRRVVTIRTMDRNAPLPVFASS